MTTRAPLPTDMLCRAIARRLHIIARRLHIIAGQYDEPWDDFRDVPPQVQRLMAVLLREVATAIEEESRR